MPSQDPSEEVAHIALETVEKTAEVGAKGIKVGAEVAGKAAVGLAHLLSVIIKAEYKSKGSVPKKYFVGKSTTIFTIMQKDLLEFSRAAKKYGVAYSAVVDRANTNPKAEVDIIIQDSNAALVQRIIEKYGFNMPDINMDDAAAHDARESDYMEEREQPEEQAQHNDGKDIESNEAAAQSEQEKEVSDIDILRGDGFINLLEEEKVDFSTKNDKKEDEKEHPTQARTETKNTRFAPFSEQTKNDEKPSVRAELNAYRQEERREAAKKTPTRVRGYEHVQTIRKPKNKEGRER